MSPARQGQKGKTEGARSEKITVWRWPLPQDVRGALTHFQISVEGLLARGPDNPALLLQRYVAFSVSEKKDPVQPNEKFSKQVFGKTLGKWGWSGNEKNQLWQAIIGRLKELYRDSKSDKGPVAKFLEHLLIRQKQLEDVLKTRGYVVETFPAEVVWRLIAGLGLPSLLETGITLHHLYGFPYLPGSAIKGVTRSWRLQQIADELRIPRLNAQQIHQWKNEKHHGTTPWERLEQLLMSPLPNTFRDEKRRRDAEERLKQRYDSLQEALNGKYLSTLKELRALSDSDPNLPHQEEMEQSYIRSFSRAFGSTEAKGEVIFLDAYPERLVVDDKPILELDVMTPHYGEYYTGDSPPADWLSPNPVLFLAVRQGTLFTIRLASRDQDLLGTVEGWVKDALREFGIGAKTRAGYGELKTDLLPQRPQEVAPELGEKEAQALSVLALAIERWTTRDMGRLAKLISDLIAHPNREERHTLAVKLQRKLLAAGRWGGKYQEKPWHRQLEELLGSKEEGRES